MPTFDKSYFLGSHWTYQEGTVAFPVGMYLKGSLAGIVADFL